MTEPISAGQIYKSETAIFTITDVTRYRIWFHLMLSGVLNDWDFDMDTKTFENHLKSGKIERIRVRG